MGKIALLVNKKQQNRVFNEKYYEKIRKFGELSIYDREDFEDLEYATEFVKGAEVIITSWNSPQISGEMLDACPDLKGVIHAAGSVKPVISDELIKRKVRITGSAVAIGEGVAETALGFAISACKSFYKLSRDTANKIWDENRFEYVKDFYDINVGVISGGFVGRHMVKLLKNFHVDILMYDPILSEEEIEKIGAKKVSLEELMSESDVVTIHAPSIPATDNMINKENLALMKDGAVLINTARGTIINEQDLIEELEKGRIFACIDVTNPEPPAPDNKLRFMDNVVLTPHIAGTVTNGLKRIALHVCEELERLLNGKKMRTEVNLDDLSKMA
ncbi:MAG: hydroxyacid dehydrogenase [Ruminococcaceae bacterium]|nr:hydroxyacid dehydrogenase [Oscillospiraceae bacterium]